jgi:hypothetical protein
MLPMMATLDADIAALPDGTGQPLRKVSPEQANSLKQTKQPSGLCLR